MSSIDVVIPCYRYGRYLRECVESVLSQDVEKIRVLIIDDASPDETPEVGASLAREDKRVSYVRHALNAGHIKTYNEGLAWVKAEYMLLLSADDYLMPGAFSRTLEFMSRNPKMSLCFAEAIELHNGGKLKPVPSNIPGEIGAEIVMNLHEFLNHCILAGSSNIVCTPTAVVRADFLKRLGLYRDDLPHSADFEMWLRLAAHGHVGFIKNPLAFYRRHDENMTLGYLNEKILADFKQRKAAFDIFREENECVVNDMPVMYEKLLCHLAQHAVGIASMAFNQKKTALCDEICEYAELVYPNIKKTRAWWSLKCKNVIGFGLVDILRRWVFLNNRLKNI